MKKFDAANQKSQDHKKKDFKQRKFKKFDKKEEVKGTAVALREGESADSLIRRFKKIVELAGIMRELRRREHYLTPSQKKKEKKKRAQKKVKKEARKESHN